MKKEIGARHVSYVRYRDNYKIDVVVSKEEVYSVEVDNPMELYNEDYLEIIKQIKQQQNGRTL